MCTNRNLFFQTGPKKNAGTMHFMFGGRIVSSSTGIQTACRRTRRLEAFLYLAAQNFNLFSKIQDQNLKNQKPIAVDVLSYQMVPLSCRSNLAGRYLQLFCFLGRLRDSSWLGHEKAQFLLRLTLHDRDL
jgi:hypothetical protein